MDPGSLLLGPGVHPEEGSISACCPHDQGWGGQAPLRLSGGGAAQMLLMGWGRHMAPTGSRAEGPGGRREGKRRLPCGPPAPARAGRPRQELTALHYPADLAGINLTIYTHANQL